MLCLRADLDFYVEVSKRNMCFRIAPSYVALGRGCASSCDTHGPREL